MEKTYIQIVKMVEKYPDLLTHPVRSRTLDHLTREFQVSPREAAAVECLFKRQLIDDSSACMKTIRNEHKLDLPSLCELLKICDALHELAIPAFHC